MNSFERLKIMNTPYKHRAKINTISTDVISDIYFLMFFIV